ncbi:hypothetical protein [Peribacillus kribbensis]|nr:hypothetical protein [Peribacillus kribbensis]
MMQIIDIDWLLHAESPGQENEDYYFPCVDIDSLLENTSDW